jgi:beta-ureidopropionase / N-carbamoyl-L-amino-acid hydrolase
MHGGNTMNSVDFPRVDGGRLMERIETLGRVGMKADGSCCRLALSDEDKLGRDLVVSWMRELGLEVRIDKVGNIIGLRKGLKDLPPVMTGSHIDTVGTGGKFDGNLGVLAGIELVHTLNDAGVETDRPLAVAVFTDEEGARFQPDMLGSLVYAGGMGVEEALAVRGIDGKLFGEELARIGYAGTMEPGTLVPSAFVELHIEQGPVLDQAGESVAAVHNLQGISWQEVTVSGKANHAGTTPMSMRHDAGYGAARTICFARELALELGGTQVATVGSMRFEPNLVNVIPRQATFTVDLRNTDEATLKEAESRLAAFLHRLAEEQGLETSSRRLARFEPVEFDRKVVSIIEESAAAMGHKCRRITSGAGQDAQMLARICPTAMIFVPSVGGISHNPTELTRPEHVELGANVLLGTMLRLSKA